MSGQTIFSDTFFAMGVHCDVVLPGLDAEKSKSVIQRVKDEVRLIEHEISRENLLSFVLKTDHSPKNKWIKVSSVFFQVLSLCADFYEMSNGAFDVTVGPLARLQAGGAQPSEEEIAAVMRHCGFDKVELDPEKGCFRFLEEEMELDFSAVEKAYALDVLKLVLADEEIGNCIVSFDEEAILALGTHPTGDAWPIGIRNVEDPNEFLHVFDITDASGLTTGTIYIRDDGRGEQNRIIVSPESGLPVSGKRTVSVKAASASLAAFLANVWLILPENDKSLLADQILNIEIFEAEYLEDDIRTKLTLNYEQEDDE